MVMGEEKENRDETTSSNGEEVDTDAEPWGTLEELLLACAVKLHGTNSWDSIAEELHNRTKKPFSSLHCKHKYSSLKRRFSAAGEILSAAGNGGDEGGVMVEQLRKLRVEELKREVHRHDISIVSLQMKVKRLEEERERTISKQPEQLSDLIRIESTTRTGCKPSSPARSSPEKVDSGRSFNESNSTNKPEQKPADEPDGKLTEPDPVEPVKDVGSGSRQGTSRPGESVSESKKEKQQQSSDVQSSASLSKKKRRRFRSGGGGGSSGDEVEAEEVSPANKRINIKSQPLIRFLEILRSHKHASVFQRRLPSQETEKYRSVIRQHMDLETVQSRLDKGVYCDCHSKFYRDLLLIFTNAVMFYRKSSAEHIAARESRKLVLDEAARKPVVKPDPDPPSHLEPVVKKPRSSSTMVVCRRRSSTSMQALSETMKKKDEDHNMKTNTSNDNMNEEKSNEKSSMKSGNVNKGEKSKGDVVVVNPIQKKVDSGGNSSSSKRPEKESDQKKVGSAKERSGLGRGGGGVGLKSASESSSKKVKSGGSNKDEISYDGDNNNNNNDNNSNNVVKKTTANNADQKPQLQEKGTLASKKQGVANFLKRMKQNSPSNQDKPKKKGNNDGAEDEEEEEEEKEIIKRSEKIESLKKKSSSVGNSKRGSREVEAMPVSGRSSGRRGGERETAVMTRRSGNNNNNNNNSNNNNNNNGRPPKRKVAMISTPDSSKGGKSGGGGGGGGGGREGDKSKKKPRR